MFPAFVLHWLRSLADRSQCGKHFSTNKEGVRKNLINMYSIPTIVYYILLFCKVLGFN